MPILMLNEFVTLCEIGKEGSESRTLLLAVVLEYVHAKSCSDSRTGNIVRDALDEGNLLDLAVNPRSTTHKSCTWQTPCGLLHPV